MPLKKYLNEGIKDEEGGVVFYKRMSRESELTKQEKEQIKSMARDEERHGKNLKTIKKRLYM